MAETNQALAYIASVADRRVPLTVLRITTLLYMSDWRSALQLKRQITDVNWVQPFVIKMSEVFHRLHAEMGVTIKDDQIFGAPVTGSPPLSDAARGCIDFVLLSESRMGWTEFFRLAYSTYPMFSQPAQATLNLIELAEKYERSQDVQRVG